MSGLTVGLGPRLLRVSTDEIEKLHNALKETEVKSIWKEMKDFFCTTEREKALDALSNFIKKKEGRQAAFNELKELASINYKDRFHSEQRNGQIILGIKLDNTKNQENGLQFEVDAEAAEAPGHEKYSEDLEKSFKEGDYGLLLKTLQEFSKSTDEEWEKQCLGIKDLQKRHEKRYDAGAKMAFAENKLKDIISSMPKETQETIYKNVTGSWGDHLRAVLGCTADALDRAVSDELLSLEKDGALMGLPLKLEQNFNNLASISAKLLGEEEGVLRSQKGVNSITEAEKKALGSLEIPDLVINLIPTKTKTKTKTKILNPLKTLLNFRWHHHAR